MTDRFREARDWIEASWPSTPTASESECYLCLEPVRVGTIDGGDSLGHVKTSLDNDHPALLASAGFDHTDYLVRQSPDDHQYQWCNTPFMTGFVCRRKEGHSGTHGCGGADTSQARHRVQEHQAIEPTKEELAEVYRSLGVTPKEE